MHTFAEFSGRGFFLSDFVRLCVGIQIGKRNGELKTGSFARRALHMDGSLHQLHQLPHDGQPQSAAAHLIDPGIHSPGKLGIHFLHKFRRHADAGIPDNGNQVQLMIMGQQLLINLKMDFTALRRIFYRVGQKVHIDLLQMQRIAKDVLVSDVMGVTEELQMLFRLNLPGCVCGILKQSGNAGIHIVQLQRAAFDAADIQHVVRDLLQIAPGDLNLPQGILQPFRVVQLILGDGSEAHDGVHGSPYIVGHTGEKIRLCLICLIGRFGNDDPVLLPVLGVADQAGGVEDMGYLAVLIPLLDDKAGQMPVAVLGQILDAHRLVPGQTFFQGGQIQKELTRS